MAKTYFKNGMTFSEISKLTGVPRPTLQVWTRHYKIKENYEFPLHIFPLIAQWKDEGFTKKQVKKMVNEELSYSKKLDKFKASKPCKEYIAIDDTIFPQVNPSAYLAIEIILQAHILEGKPDEKQALRKILTEFMKG